MSRTALLAALLVLLGTATALAVRVEMVRDDGLGLGRGVKIAGLALSSPRYTGWVQTGQDRSMVYEIDLVDANSSITAVTMSCKSTNAKGEADGAGRAVHSLSVSAGTALSKPLTWCNAGTSSTCTAADGAGPGSTSWTWTVSNLPSKYVNCLFTGAGAPGASDLLTVSAVGLSP